MGIDVAWITESGEAKQQVYDPRQCVTRLATSIWPTQRDTVCLRFIDAWGDTTFNQAQVPMLVNELRSSLAGQTDVEICAHLEKVIRLVERAVGQTHTYVRFIGD